MEHSLFTERRNSKMELGNTYFWTNTVKNWKNLIIKDKYKNLILITLDELVQNDLVTVFAFVIMPNHFHLIWKINSMNGKEMPNASLNKKISHLIIKDLKLNHQQVLPYFQVSDKDRSYRIWQRDPLAVIMDTKEKVEQKIEYIHLNPLQEKWNLAKYPEDYYWSSADFYQNGIDNFGFLTDYREEF